MLYSDYLKTQKVTEALQKAGVNEIPSPFEDHSIPGDQPIQELIPQIIDREILNRRLSVEHEAKINEYKRKYSKEIHIEEKAEFIRQHIAKVVSGNLNPVYESLEEGLIVTLSKRAAENFDFEINGEVKSQPDYNGLSELERILKQSSIMRLSREMSLEEIALNTVYNSSFSKFMK